MMYVPKTGDQVRIIEDRGDYGKLATVLNAKPYNYSSQCFVDLDGVITAVPRHELRRVSDG